MIGALDWLMGARSFDALRLHGFFGDKVEGDAFGSMLASQQNFVDDTVAPPVTVQNNGSYLAAVNAIYKHSAALRLEGYVLYRHDRPSVFLPLPVKNDIVSPGIYVTGLPADGLKYTGELTFQGGRQNDLSFFAFAVSGDVEYTFEAKLKPTIYGGFAYASGASQDGKVNEFNNFFPTNHKFYGAADLFGLRNLIDGHVAVGITTPNAPVGLKLEPCSSGGLCSGRRCREATPCSSPTKADGVTAMTPNRFTAPRHTCGPAQSLRRFAAWHLLDQPPAYHRVVRLARDSHVQPELQVRDSTGPHFARRACLCESPPRIGVGRTCTD